MHAALGAGLPESTCSPVFCFCIRMMGQWKLSAWHAALGASLPESACSPVFCFCIRMMGQWKLSVWHTALEDGLPESTCSLVFAFLPAPPEAIYSQNALPCLPLRKSPPFARLFLFPSKRGYGGIAPMFTYCPCLLPREPFSFPQKGGIAPTCSPIALVLCRAPFFILP